VRYKIGLDIGVASVGWSVLELNECDEPVKIIKMGSRIFEAAEHPKDGSPLAKPRRDARSARRRLRRHVHRNERIRALIVSRHILKLDELEQLFDGRLEDIYYLRKKGLDELLTNSEFARVLIHLAQRRGFVSNRSADAKDKEAGQLLGAIKSNNELMEKHNYRTAGEMLASDDTFANRKRNQGDYKNVVSRKDIEHEARLIFAAQRRLGFAFADEITEEKYLTILLSQRSFDQGPGGDSPYKVDFGNMVGSCSLIEGEKRSAKFCHSFERFTLLTNINHIRINQSGSERPLSETERRDIIERAYKKSSLTYADIRKVLSIAETDTFNIRYDSDGIDKAEKKKFNFLTGYHKIKTALDKNKPERISFYIELLDDIAYAMTVTKDDDRLKEKLAGLRVEPLDIEQLINENKGFSKFGHISLKACKLLNPYLEQGMTYDQACDAAGLDFKGYCRGEKSKFLHYQDIAKLDDLTNPVVRRAVSQTIKVINAIIREMGGSPSFVGIELAREMSQTRKDRDAADKSMQENSAKNERIKAKIQEYGISNPKGCDIVKMKLWEEQDGICPYCQTSLAIEHLFEHGYAEIDHIIPRSISHDDSYKNKALICADCNRRKGNKLPLEFLQGEQRDKFEVWVSNSVRNRTKRNHMLKSCITEEDEKAFKERNLNDTRYISRLMMNILQDYLQFGDSGTGKKKRVIAVNGAVTSYIRKRWGISKIRADGDKHHAVDSVVVACVTEGMIRKISQYEKRKELQYIQTDVNEFIVDGRTGEIIDETSKHFPYPYSYFRKELEARASNQSALIIEDLKLPTYNESLQEASPIFVSRMPRKKATGAAHKETVFSPKAIEDGYVLKSVPLTSLKFDNGEIKNYYERAKQSDPGLYTTLVERLQEYGGNAEKAFENGFIRPGWSDNHPPLRKVKLQEPSTLNVSVHSGKGVAANDSMVRIDVFHIDEGKDKGYYFVPIYVADTKKPHLPNKAVVAHKKYEDWKEMNDEDFIFSVYPGELLKVKHKRILEFTLMQKESLLPGKYTTQEEFVYFIGANVASGAIGIKTHDGAYSIGTLGIKSLMSLEKYAVDVLGNITPVGKEKRLSFSKMEG
jgi:CRISPR-associated endonuclease Csn1